MPPRRQTPHSSPIARPPIPPEVMEQGFKIPHQVVTLLHGFRHPWFFAGGWAIDPFLGRPTREHADVEITVARNDQIRLQTYLRGWTLQKVAEGRLQPWNLGERLELPVHEIHAERTTGIIRKLEVLLNE